MSKRSIEFLSDFSSSRIGSNPDDTSCWTDNNSVISVTPGNLQITGFTGFGDNQRISWDLDRATLGLQLGVLCLVVPNDLSPTSAWIPIAQLRPDREDQADALRAFVTAARQLLGRPLPPGRVDS